MKNLLTILTVTATLALGACSSSNSCPASKKSSCCASGSDCSAKAPAKKKP